MKFTKFAELPLKSNQYGIMFKVYMNLVYFNHMGIIKVVKFVLSPDRKKVETEQIFTN